MTLTQILHVHKIDILLVVFVTHYILNMMHDFTRGYIAYTYLHFQFILTNIRIKEHTSFIYIKTTLYMTANYR